MPSILKRSRINSSQYRLVYEPNHPSSYQRGNWKGYVYEHRFVVENELGRILTKEEVIHHLDGDSLNNRKENLLVLTRGMHSRLHRWIERGAPGIERAGENRVNSEKAKSAFLCASCGRSVKRYNEKYCSISCYKRDKSSSSKRPPKKVLEDDLSVMNYSQIGRKYQVSDNAVRKWVRFYRQADMPTLSQAENTFSEGAETTGEVETS